MLCTVAGRLRDNRGFCNGAQFSATRHALRLARQADLEEAKKAKDGQA